MINILVCTKDKNGTLFNRFYKSLINTTQEIFYKLTIVETSDHNKFHHPSIINSELEKNYDLLITCDDDIVFSNNWLGDLLNVYNEDKNNEIGLIGFVNSTKDKKILNNIVISKPSIATVLCSPCIAIKKTHVRMNTNYIKYYFDLDFCLSMWENNKKIICMPNVIYHDRYGSFNNNNNSNNIINEIIKKDKDLFFNTWIKSGRMCELKKKIKEEHKDAIKGQPIVLCE